MSTVGKGKAGSKGWGRASAGGQESRGMNEGGRAAEGAVGAEGSEVGAGEGGRRSPVRGDEMDRERLGACSPTRALAPSLGSQQGL